ncbi:MAG TPA: hypothetical protein VII28_13495 [Puia sp.]
MRGIKILFFLIFLAAKSIPVLAQQKTLSNPWHFQSFVNVGLLEGQTGSAFLLQTINGACYKSWFAGVGLGLDYYRVRTIPLFIDIRKEFGKSSGKLFVYVDGGISFGWATDMQKTGYLLNDQFQNGFYDDVGLGYKTAVGKKSALLISLGYSYKKVNESYSSPYYYTPNYYFTDPGIMPQNDPKEQISYSLNRLSMKIGWTF